jgi:hypothetical protein
MRRMYVRNVLIRKRELIKDCIIILLKHLHFVLSVWKAHVLYGGSTRHCFYTDLVKNLIIFIMLTWLTFIDKYYILNILV